MRRKQSGGKTRTSGRQKGTGKTGQRAARRESSQSVAEEIKEGSVVGAMEGTYGD